MTKTNANSFKALVVWQKGMGLAKQVYQLTDTFPASEKYVLVAQMRRAGVSVPSNIAEGQARRSRREFIQFVSHAEGSAAELETQLILSKELGYCSGAGAQATLDLIEEVRKMLFALRKRLSTNNSQLTTDN
jgi:four helix bundle protein